MPLNRAKVVKNAEKFLRQGKIDAAIAEYQLLVQESPKDLNTINKIGDLYARHGKIREAIAQFTKIAEFYSADGFLLKAIAIYKKINKLDPNYMEANQHLADLYSQQGLVMEAKSQYQAVAEHYLKAGQLEKTRGIFEKLLKLAPDDLKSRLALAELCVKEKNVDQAVQEYLGVAQELDRRDMAKESVRIYQTALKLAPGSRDVLDRLVRALSQQGDHDHVIDLLKDQIKNRRDPGLMALLAQAYLGKDRLKEAKKLLEEATSIDSEAVEIRVALGRLQLKQGDLDAAFKSLSEVSARLEQDKKLNEASHLWEEFVRERPEHAEALGRLEDLYRKRDHPAKADATASALADVLIRQGNQAAARKVLERLIVSDAGNPHHRERLRALGTAAAAPRPAPRPSPTPPPADELPEVELAEADEPAAAAPAATTRSAPAPAELEDLPESAEEEDAEFISERLTEAEVFVKYGLVDKALEQLQTVLKRFPRCLPARRKLKEIYQENGDTDRAVRECLHLARILRERDEGPAAQETLEEARGLGGSPALQLKVRQALGEEAEAEAVETAEPVVEVVPEIAAQAVPDLDLDLTPAEPAPAAPPASELESGLELEPIEPSAAASAGPIESGETLEIEIETGTDAEPGEEQLKEVDFYLEQGLEDEARGLLEKLRSRAPDSPAVRQRLARLSPGGGTAPSRPARGAAAASDAANILAEIERELNENVEDVPGSPAATKASAGGGGEFFDLSSELDESLFEAQTAVEDAAPVPTVSDDEHSLEEIFKAFKKGVEQQVEATDYETHYNLGIAYKEMDLVEEAIGEFQVAAKDPKRLLQCCSMLGICFKEKGMTNLALKWYQRGIDSPNYKDEEYQGLKYDVAVLHMEMGDYARARDLFTDVYGMNAKYRDVSQKLKELERLIVHGK
jgi:tetratricopeptide (TPR) repeat protein